MQVNLKAAADRIIEHCETLGYDTVLLHRVAWRPGDDELEFSITLADNAIEYSGDGAFSQYSYASLRREQIFNLPPRKVRELRYTASILARLQSASEQLQTEALINLITDITTDSLEELRRQLPDLSDE